jgi:aminopeptidase N
LILVTSVKPVHYDISLYDLELEGNFRYGGTVKIDLEVTRTTKEITLNALELKLHSAEIKSSNGTRMV